MRSLWPREHGAYAQLAAPLLAALAVRTPTAAAVLLATGACCAFLANEPLLVGLGHRGARMRELAGRRARRRLAMLATGCALAVSIGFALATRATFGMAAIAAVPAAVMVVFAWRSAEHSLAGELVAAVALPGAGAPVVVASGASWAFAAVLWAAWSIGFACSVVAVHRVIARHKRQASRVDAVIAVGLACVTLACTIAAWTAVPLAGLSTALAIRPPSARRLRAVGVALVIASLASGAIAITG